MKKLIALVTLSAVALVLAGCTAAAPLTHPGVDGPATGSARPSAQGSGPVSSANPNAVNCDNGTAVINQPGNEYRFAADCATVVVQGTGITVAAKGITRLVVQGNEVKVLATSVGNLTLNGQYDTIEVPAMKGISIAGNDNLVRSSASGTSVIINGNNNTIETGASATVTKNGTGNVVSVG